MSRECVSKGAPVCSRQIERVSLLYTCSYAPICVATLKYDAIRFSLFMLTLYLSDDIIVVVALNG